MITFRLSTNASDGLIFWHGQTPEKNGTGQDYIALAGKTYFPGYPSSIF